MVNHVTLVCGANVIHLAHRDSNGEAIFVPHTHTHIRATKIVTIKAAPTTTSPTTNNLYL